jgi:hypothetical protein
MQSHIGSVSFLLGALALLAPCAGQAPTPAPSQAQIFDKASASVALVLATQTPGDTTPSVGAAIVVYQDGDLLTAYHLVRNAYAVQLRFKSGEVFDRVQLLGFDARRDIAAIRIPASAMPVLPIGSASNANIGDRVLSIFHPLTLPWSTSTGIVTAYRLADEIPGAGSGFRVIQFTAPASPGASGGVLLDAQGRVLGIVTGQLSAQNLNLAVPIENVLGLADTIPVKTFASGALLTPPNSVAPPALRPPSEPAQAASVAVPDKSETLNTSKDHDFIFHHFETMYVDAHAAKFFDSDQMKAALVRNKDFAALHISIVDDPKAADTILVVGYTFAWDFPFELKHQKSSIVLLAGKGIGPFSGVAGAASVASEFVKAAKPYRATAAGQK